jgi:hypothetical protein
MTNYKLLAIAAFLTIVLASLVGAMYFKPTGDYIKSSTQGSIIQGPGEYVGNGLQDVGHSLAVAWIFVGVTGFVLVCIIVYIKTRPKQPTSDYYNYY